MRRARSLLRRSMLHTRTHKIENVAGASALAIYLTWKVNALDAGFRFRGYLWLNDSTSEDALQEYAVVRELDGLQVESVTVSPWSQQKEAELAAMIRKVVDGLFDNSETAEHGVFVDLGRSASERAAERLLADLGKFDLLPEYPVCVGHRPIRESEAERRAKAEASELTPEALAKPGLGLTVAAPGDPVAVRVEHVVRPGQRAFCRVSFRPGETGQLGMFRSDDDGGHAIEVGVFVEQPPLVTLFAGPHGLDTAWFLATS